MAVLELQTKNQALSQETRGSKPDTDPMFYSVPFAGVKYYTFDYRPALRKMVERWDREQEAPAAETPAV